MVSLQWLIGLDVRTADGPQARHQERSFLPRLSPPPRGGDPLRYPGWADSALPLSQPAEGLLVEVIVGLHLDGALQAHDGGLPVSQLERALTSKSPRLSSSWAVTCFTICSAFMVPQSGVLGGDTWRMRARRLRRSSSCHMVCMVMEIRCWGGEVNGGGMGAGNWKLEIGGWQLAVGGR